MRRLEYEPLPPGSFLFDCHEWKGRVVIGRWSWFWKRIQFWRYEVIRLPQGAKALWRFK